MCSCAVAAAGAAGDDAEPLKASAVTSPYLFKASAAPLVHEAPGLQIKEAHMLGGMALRLQVRSAGAIHPAGRGGAGSRYL